MAVSTPKIDSSLSNDLGYVPDNRNHLAACHLNVQHYLWQNALKFHVHPSIPTPKADAIIADVAAGTGAWLTDVTRQYPCATLEGLDNDLTQAPHQNWLPKNLKMRHWEVFHDVPEDLVGKYDFCARETRVLKNLWKMLKPGGYLQWDELDCVNMQVKKVDPSIPAPTLEELREMTYANRRYSWVLSLSDSMSEEGFRDARIEKFGDPHELVRAFNEQHLLTMEMFAWGLVREGRREAGEVFLEVVREGRRESVGGAALCIPRVVCWGRKAGEEE